MIGRGLFTVYQLDFSPINVDDMRVLGKGVLLSPKTTGTAILVGIVWGTLLVMTRLSDIKPLQVFGQAYVNLFRSIPLVMVLLWFFLTVPQVLQKIFNLSPATGMRMTSALVAFTLFEAAYYLGVIHVGIQSASHEQMFIAYTMNMTHGQAMRLVILPQTFRSMIPLLLAQAIVLFQDTSLVYVSALSGLFTQAYNIGERDGHIIELLLFTGLCYFVICFGTSMLVKRLQKKVTQ